MWKGGGGPRKIQSGQEETLTTFSWIWLLDTEIRSDACPGGRGRKMWVKRLQAAPSRFAHAALPRRDTAQTKLSRSAGTWQYSQGPLEASAVPGVHALDARAQNRTA